MVLMKIAMDKLSVKPNYQKDELSPCIKLARPI